jgi:hypothetical protein
LSSPTKKNDDEAKKAGEGKEERETFVRFLKRLHMFHFIFRRFGACENVNYDIK